MRQGAPVWQRISDVGLKASYGITLLILLFCAGMTLSGFRDTAENSAWVEHTYQALSSLEAILSHINEAQSVERAFVIGGNPKVLVAYRKVVAQVSIDEDEIARLTADNSSQVKSLGELRILVSQKLATMESGVVRRSAPGMSADKMASGVTAGQDLLEKVQAKIGAMQNEERRLLNIRIAATSRHATLSLISFAATTIFSVLLLTGVFSLIVRLNRNFSDTQEQQVRYSDQLEQEVQRTALARKELERSNRELQDFAFVASHDLQEPLRKIRSYGDRVVRRLGPDLDPTSQSDLSRMQSSAERMQGLINDILTLSRVSAKAHPFANVDLNTVFDEVIDDLEARIQQTGATVVRGNLPVVYADAMQMRQLIQNLVGNALKFLRPDEPGRVAVEPHQSPPKGFQGFLVVDNGIGFEDKHAEKIFTVFQRLNSRASYEGSGVGLAICRRIVERHGGSIEARGVLGKGATFVVNLPAAKAGEQNT